MAAATRRRSGRGWPTSSPAPRPTWSIADASCSGGDPLALCAGAIVAFPATSGARRCGAAAGFTPITALNVVRLGRLSLIAENRTLLDLLHVYIWPAILILASAGFVYARV